MKLCIPVIEDKGSDSKVSAHFGSAPFFLIFDPDTKSTDYVANSNQHHSHGMCQPLSLLSGYKLDAVVCSGMGGGAIAKLNASGIRTYRGSSATVKEIIDDFVAGKLPELTPEGACAGHGCH